ncbi:hypothetical protein L484_022980 [Morus notabilis]|uniref:Uncharacterized protein n=1 Tax=Morus notabilis TaxID=981085 RepID=W9RK12_9ROSA|nr:hypothetical protein L484_022980 [Morus notabilis]
MAPESLAKAIAPTAAASMESASTVAEITPCVETEISNYRHSEDQIAARDFLLKRWTLPLYDSEMDELSVHRLDVDPKICTSDVDSIVKLANIDVDDFKEEEEVDETLEEYVDDEVREDDQSDYDSNEPIDLIVELS